MVIIFSMVSRFYMWASCHIIENENNDMHVESHYILNIMKDKPTKKAPPN